MPGPDDKKVIAELITHVNKLESRIKDVQTSLSDMNDLQLLNKLDIINLKNEIDKLKMVLPGGEGEEVAEFELPPEMPSAPIERLKEEPEEAPPKPKPRPKEVKEKPKNFLVCKKCGAIMPKNAKFCGKCGKKV